MRFSYHAFVDWDDTIAENIRYFNETEERLSAYLSEVTGSDPQAVRARGAELDIMTARRMGLVRESLHTAWLSCYEEFCQARQIRSEMSVKAQIQAFCRHPYEVRQELLPGAAQTMQWLFETGCEVTIWTAGDPEVQHRKVAESGLEHLLHRKVVVVSKTAERLQAALEDRHLSVSFVVGNSIHSDINPALTLGMNAYHVPAETWAYDHAELDTASPHYRRLSAIGDLPQVLRRMF